MLKFNLAKDNISNTWKLIKNIINADYNCKQNVTEISINSSSTTDCNIISSKFNDYFVNVGPNLAKNIPQINDDSVTNYITGSYPNSMSILKSTLNEIINIVCLF